MGRWAQWVLGKVHELVAASCFATEGTVGSIKFSDSTRVESIDSLTFELTLLFAGRHYGLLYGSIESGRGPPARNNHDASDEKSLGLLPTKGVDPVPCSTRQTDRYGDRPGMMICRSCWGVESSKV